MPRLAWGSLPRRSAGASGRALRRRAGRRHHSLNAERLERRDLLSVSVARTSLNLRFSADLKPNESAYGEYQSFAITNDGPTPLADVWVRATDFDALQKVQLGPGEDGLYFLGDLGIGAASAETAFIYMVAEEITSPPAPDPQPFTIEVWQGRPDAPGSTLLGAQADLFQWVGEANQDDSSSRTFSVDVQYAYGGVPTAGPVVGGTMTMTVTGDIKNKPDRILFTPASTIDWPADAFVLEDAVVSYSKNPQLPPDAIFEKPIASKPKDFTVVYSFRVAEPTATPTPVTPLQYTANGVQDLQSRKFDHSKILEGVPDIPPAIEGTDLQITKTGATTAVAGSATEYSYTITVASTGAFAAQDVVVTDLWPAAFTRLPIDPPPGTTIAPTATGFTWTIGTLPAGTVTTLTVNFTVPAGTPPGPFTNTAIVSSSTPDPGPATAEITTTVVPAAITADLEIEKRDFVQEYAPGETLTWQITVTNRGPNAVTGARVQDIFPPQVSGVTWTATFTGGSGTSAGSGTIDQLIDLGPGGTAVYTVIATTFPTALGSLVNTATVTTPTGVTDPNLSNNSWTDIDLSAPRADLAITKVDASPNYVPGEATVYTVTVTNNGPSFVAGATVNDTFSTAFTGVTWTATFTGVGSSGAREGSGNLAQTINLAAGGTATYTITALVDPAATTSITNTATVAPPLGTTDPVLANNTATDTNTAAPEVFLAITKTDATDTYTPGLTTTYSVVVSNTGPSFLTDGRLVDVFPAAIVGATWTASYEGPGSGGADSGVGDIDAAFNLAVGGTATFTITAPVARTATGNLVNTAIVLVPPGTENTNPVNSATDTDTPAPVADLRAAKTDGSATYLPGTTTTYTITISNFGPSAVQAARITDTFDPAMFDVAGVSWTAVLQDGSTIGGTGDIDVTLDIDRGNAEQVIVFTVTAPILPGATGLLSNTVTVTPPPGTTDPNPANNTAVDIDTPAGAPELYADLSIEKRDFVQQYAPGETLTWTITVINAGPNAVTGARVLDAFPIQVGSMTWEAEFTGGSGTGSGSGTVIDELISLDPGGRAVYTVVAQTLPTATGPLTNVATVTAPLDVTDPNLTNNTWTDVDQVGPVADLVLTKVDGSPNYIPGEVTTYTVTVTNDGPSQVVGARVVDTFSTAFTNVTWVAVFSPGSSGTSDGSGDIDELITLAAGGTATYTITATTSPWASTTIVNTATVTAPDGTLDPDLANNTATDINTATPQVYLELTKTDNTGTYVPGETLAYTITVTNTGPSALVGGTLVDDLPAAIVGATWTATYAGSGSTGPGVGSGDLDANFTLAVGGRATFRIVAPVASTTTGPLVNTASIAVPPGTTNTNPVTEVTDIDAAAPVADLRAFKTDNRTTYEPGTITTYTLTISNFGPSMASGARVTDTFDPTMFDVANVQWTAVLPDGSTRSGTGDIDEVFDLDRGNAEEVIVFTVSAPIRATATGPLSNTVTVTPPAGTADYNLTNNQSTDVELEAPGNGRVIVAADLGCESGSLVSVLDSVTGAVRTQFYAYEPGFRGGVRVYGADVTGDGIAEIVTAPGPGRQGEIRVFTHDGIELPEYRSLPFGAGYDGGVEVAVGSLTGPGTIELVAGQSRGGLVNVFTVTPSAARPVASTPVRQVQPFGSAFRGGVSVAAADLGSFTGGALTSADPDGIDELALGSGPGRRATVNVYNAVPGPPQLVNTLQPFAGVAGMASYARGVGVAALPSSTGAADRLLVSAGTSGGSRVETYAGTGRIPTGLFAAFGGSRAATWVAALDETRIFAVEGIGGDVAGVRQASSISGPTTTLTSNPQLPAPQRVGVLPARRAVVGPVKVSAPVASDTLTVLEGAGSMTLARDLTGRLFVGGSMITLGGAAVNYDAYAALGWEAGAVDAVDGVHTLVWRHASGALHFWRLSPTGAHQVSEGWVLPGSAEFFAAETAFGVDFDDDAVIGVRLTVLEGAGSVTLAHDAAGRLFAGGSMITLGGAAVDYHAYAAAGWEAVAAEFVDGVHTLVWRHASGALHFWRLSPTGAHQVSEGWVLPGSAEFFAAETAFGADFDDEP